jgi:hypothetical protein
LRIEDLSVDIEALRTEFALLANALGLPPPSAMPAAEAAVSG